jgi:hypothetical protein
MFNLRWSLCITPVDHQGARPVDPFCTHRIRKERKELNPTIVDSSNSCKQLRPEYGQSTRFMQNQKFEFCDFVPITI